MQKLVFCLWILMSVKIIKDSVVRMDTGLWNKILFEAFAYYNPLVMVAMMLWLWGVNIFVFLRSRVNYAKVFDLDHNHLTHREIWKVSADKLAEVQKQKVHIEDVLPPISKKVLRKRIGFVHKDPVQIAAWVTLTVVTSMTAYLYLESYGETQLAASQPVLLYCLLPLILALPLDVFYSSSRFYFMNTVVRMIFPFQPISYADFFVADVLTSMSKVLSDVERAVCKMYYHEVTGVRDDDVNLRCGNHSYWIPCILAFPYLCRFFQCLRQYSDTRDKSCLFNALKYSTTFPVIILSAMKYHIPPDLLLWESRYRPLWLLWSVINTCYSFYWDVTRDWDFGLLTLNCKTKKPLLRTNLLYNRRWVYYWAIWSNLVLRCSWTFKLSAHLRHNRLTVFTFSALEMLRRFQWIFFRVECEYNKMITRAAPTQIPLKEIDVESEHLLSVSDHDV